MPAAAILSRSCLQLIACISNEYRAQISPSGAEGCRDSMCREKHLEQEWGCSEAYRHGTGRASVPHGYSPAPFPAHLSLRRKIYFLCITAGCTGDIQWAAGKGPPQASEQVFADKGLSKSVSDGAQNVQAGDGRLHLWTLPTMEPKRSANRCFLLIHVFCL